ncbi:MAG: hypothetical protein IJY81_06090, partial [Lachnospiraceae bacterium]|nr:hypothetical protein [Lachnospiraceae bacterium]
ICEHFDLEILEVKETRVDYCWHSNYLQNPEKYFRIDNFVEMQVSQFSRIRYDYQFKSNQEYENDYIALGKRGNKCYVRIYLKTKEVVEQGYKSWFFKEWLFNGLISRYDNYVLEKAFVKKSWKYVDKARLEFYQEFGNNKAYVDECAAILSGELVKSNDYIATLADKLTPRITLVTNVEYQTSRRFSKSFNFYELKNNKNKYDSPCQRIYDYLDNRRLIIDYLTSRTLRLVVPDPNEANRSRLEYNAFWKALRACRIVDVKKAPKDIKLVRDYSSQLNKERVKNNIISSLSTYSLYEKGLDNEDSAFADSADFISSLNDNDMQKFRQHKFKKSRLLNKKLDYGSPGATAHNYLIVNSDTGEILGGGF